MTTTMRADTRPRTSTLFPWVVTAAQFAYAIWFGVCVWLALDATAHVFGHVAPRPEDWNHEADVAGWLGGSASWIGLTSFLEPLLTAASIFTTAALLFHRGTRSSRLLLWCLVASAAMIFATLVVYGTTPAGVAIRWLGDDYPG
jgi:hypothetical protein